MGVVDVSGVSVGDAKLVLIAGPCVIEDDAGTLDLARRIADICARADVPFIFKASYDKANRTSAGSFRGPGLEAGLETLARVKAKVGCPVLSDVHDPVQVERAAEVLDVIQIPAFLCRQTDLLVAAASTGKPVNLKKGQFLAPWDMSHVVAKVESVGNRRIILTERGTCFGYNNLVSDMRSLPILRRFGYPVAYDATHSVQLPGGQGRASGGQREMVPVLARAAVAAGIDALFLEVHHEPERAQSDAASMLPLAELHALLETALRVHAAARFSKDEKGRGE